MPICTYWDDVLSEFEKYNNLYTAKYGVPDIETFEYGALTPGTSAFHDALESDDVTYRSIYTKDNIVISLSLNVALTSDTTDGYQLLIMYINGDNYIYEED